MCILALALACADGPGGTPGATLTTPTATGTTGTPGTATQQGCTDRHQPFLDALAADLEASDALAISAAVMEDGAVTCRAALGQRSADDPAPPSVDTLFQVGSITKMFTALALLQRVEAGDLALSDTLAEVVPDSEFALDASWNDAIRMDHLLTHQGGFYDYVDLLASEDDDDLVAWHEEVFFPYLWLMSPPGAFWNYANPNFDVAGLVLETLDNRYYPDIMREDVFGPLGMERTWQRREEVEADGDYAVGTGYIVEGPTTLTYGELTLDDVPFPAHGRPAGVSTYTTPDQLLRMAAFLFEGQPEVLGDTLRSAMTTGHVPLQLTPDDVRYGYGVMDLPGFWLAEGDYRELPAWSHDGATNAYTASFFMVPDQRFAVAVMASGYAADLSGTVLAALSTLVDLPEPAADPPAYPWDPDRLDLHVGTYEDPYNVGEMVVAREGDVLTIEMPLLAAYGYDVEPELVPVSSDIWLVSIDGAWYDLTFIAEDPEGPSTWLRNRYFVGTRQGMRRHAEGAPALPVAGPPSPEAVRRALRAGRLPAFLAYLPPPPESVKERFVVRSP